MVVSLCSFWVNLNGKCFEYLANPMVIRSLFFGAQTPQQVGYFCLSFSLANNSVTH